MLYSFDDLKNFHKYLLVAVFVSYFIDCVLILLIKKKKNHFFNNRYYNIQKKYSFKLVTLFKTIFILLLVYFLVFPPGNAGTVGATAILYCLVVFVLLFDYLLSMIKGKGVSQSK